MKTAKYLLAISVIAFVIALTMGVQIFAAEDPVITVDNYTVTITEADSIKDMRYALGEYNTAAEIKAAEGNVALDNNIVKQYTVDGSFVYEMPKGGYYTIWVRMLDGTNHILPLDVTKFTPYVSADGVRVTLHNLYDVKDFYIAKGEFSTYREIKDNGYIFSAGAVKINGKHNYTHTVYEPGVHTVLIRYNDGSTSVFHNELVVDEPVFTANGLQVTVSNIPGVKVIRTAYKKWNTTKELKATETLRNFSNKTAIKGAESYKIQYRKEGMVTIIVEYNNGYVKVFHHNVQQKKATLVQDSTGVTFSNLDGLVNIRYAKGKYDSVSRIKGAPDSKVVMPSEIVDGHIKFSDFDEEMYTFCVQYDDESYNYYRINVNYSPQSYESDSGKLPYWLYTPDNPTKDMPLIVVLHNAHMKANTLPKGVELSYLANCGDSYNDISEQLYHNEFGEDIPAYIIMPQTSGASRGWAKRGAEIIGLIKYYVEEYGLDSSNVNLIGHSIGGIGVWELITAYPKMFNNVVTVAGGLDGVVTNTRPYINGRRIELSETYYKELRVEKPNPNNSAEKLYETETMKCLYYSGTAVDKYQAKEGDEKNRAEKFKEERINKCVDILKDSQTNIWCILNETDSDVESSVAQELCSRISSARVNGATVTHELLTDYSHESILDWLIQDGNSKNIIDYLLGKTEKGLKE